MKIKSLRLLRPSAWRASFQVARSLWFDYGHLRTALTKSCVDPSGTPVPWYTYPAIEYLKQLDFSDKDIFEFGSGNSTLFWAARAKRVVSVEDDREWFELMLPKLPAQCQLLLETDLIKYPETIRRTGERFDVVVVDGAARGHTRLKCSLVAAECLRDGGMIILDNSDWLPESARVLREAGLIEVDMTGFAPISSHTQTTSIFLHREFAFKPRGQRQPMPGPGAADKVWERPTPTEPPLVQCGGATFGGVRRDVPVVWSSAGGTRNFRFIVSESRQYETRCAALLDVDHDRVLLTLHERTGDKPTAEREIEALTKLPWRDFVLAVNRNDKRRDDLKADSSTAG